MAFSLGVQWQLPYSFPCSSGPLLYFYLHCSQSNLSKMQRWTHHWPTQLSHVDPSPTHIIWENIQFFYPAIQTSRDRSRLWGTWHLLSWVWGSFLMRRNIKFWMQNQLQGLWKDNASEAPWSITFTNFLVYLPLLRELLYCKWDKVPGSVNNDQDKVSNPLKLETKQNKTLYIF